MVGVKRRWNNGRIEFIRVLVPHFQDIVEIGSEQLSRIAYFSLSTLTVTAVCTLGWRAIR
jgi:hypothetical protein